MSALSVLLPEPLSEQVRRLAVGRGVSAEQLVALIVSEEIAAAEDFRQLEERAARGRIEDFDRVMEAVPDAPPMPGDELPPEELAYWREVRAQRKRSAASFEP